MVAVEVVFGDLLFLLRRERLDNLSEGFLAPGKEDRHPDVDVDLAELVVFDDFRHRVDVAEGEFGYEEEKKAVFERLGWKLLLRFDPHGEASARWELVAELEMVDGLIADIAEELGEIIFISVVASIESDDIEGGEVEVRAEIADFPAHIVVGGERVGIGVEDIEEC